MCLAYFHSNWLHIRKVKNRFFHEPNEEQAKPWAKPSIMIFDTSIYKHQLLEKKLHFKNLFKTQSDSKIWYSMIFLPILIFPL